MALGKKTGGGSRLGKPNKATAQIKALAQPYTQEVLGILLSIARCSESDPARVAASKEILDRGHGKSTQPIKNDEESGGFVVNVVKFAGNHSPS